MYTVLTEAEARLNFRPISACVTGDADDLENITASHFLTGKSLLVPPQHPLPPIKNLQQLNIGS